MLKNLLAAATIVAGLALAPAALAVHGPQGSAFITDTLGGNGRPARAYTPTASPKFITDTLGGNGGAPLTAAASGENSFNWADVRIDVAGAVGTALLLVGGSLIVLRRRGRLAL